MNTENNTKIIRYFFIVGRHNFWYEFSQKTVIFIFKLFTNHIFHLRCKVVVVKQELNSFSCSIYNGDKDRQVCSQYIFTIIMFHYEFATMDNTSKHKMFVRVW